MILEKLSETGYPARRGGIADILEQRRLHKRAQKLRGFGAQEDLRQTGYRCKTKITKDQKLLNLHLDLQKFHEDYLLQL